MASERSVSPRRPQRLFGRLNEGSQKLASVHNGSPCMPRDTSMVAEVVFGWGTDPDSHAAAEAQDLFAGSAGIKTKELDFIERTKKRSDMGVEVQMDRLLHGGDLRSTMNHGKYLQRYETHSGLRTSETVIALDRRGIKQQGCELSRLAVADQVIFGHDIDGSGDYPHEEFMDTFGDRAGIRCREQKARIARSVLTHESVVDTLIQGKEEFVEEPLAEAMKQVNEGAAGIRAPRKPREKNGDLQMKSSIPEVVYNKERTPIQEGHCGRKFMDCYDTHAGIRTGQGLMLRTSSCPGPRVARVHPQWYATQDSLPAEKVEPGELMEQTILARSDAPLASYDRPMSVRSSRSSQRSFCGNTGTRRHGKDDCGSSVASCGSRGGSRTSRGSGTRPQAPRWR